MTSTLPTMAQCTKCKKEFGIGALCPGTRTMPMLVVINRVTSVEEALANAQCQDCLCLGGPASKGLERILKSLLETIGSDASATSPTVVALPGRDADAQQALMDSLLSQSGAAHAPDRGRHHRGGDDHRGPSRRETREALRAQPKPPRGMTLDEAALSALQKAREGMEAQEAQRKRSRLAQFGGLMGSLKRRLLKIRELAALQAVDDLIDAFTAKLEDAIPLDPKNRGRKKLLTHLGTSHTELAELSVTCYHSNTVVPGEGDNGLGSVRGSLSSHLEPRDGKVRSERESLMMDPFPGGARPVHWSRKGAGRQAMLGLVPVVGGSTFPEPNPSRDQYAGPVITYAADRVFIRLCDDSNAFDQAVQGHGTLRLCDKGMYAVMEKQDGVWVYHPCLPADPGAALETLQFVRLTMRRVDGTLITQWEHDRRLAEEEVRLQEMDEVAAVRRDLLIACVEVSDQGERELPHEIQIAIGLHIGEYDDEPTGQQPVLAEPSATKSVSAEETSPVQLPKTDEGQRSTA